MMPKPMPHMEMMGEDVASTDTNKILIVSNLPIGITPDVIFRLFSLYGNVHKVKIMFKKRDTALVEL